MGVHTALLLLILAAAFIVIDWLSLEDEGAPFADDGEDWANPERRHRGW